MTRRTMTHARRATALLGAALLTAACASGGGFQVETGPEGEVSHRVPEGTVVTAELEDRLSVEESEVGDNFHATVDEPVVRGGRTVLPPGALLHGEVTAVHASTGGDDPNILKVQFNRIDVRGRSYTVDLKLMDANPKTETGKTIEKIGLGTAAGAVLGAIIGDDEGEGAIIGGAIGAAAGTAVALGTKEEKAILERGSKVKLRLEEPLDLAG